MDIGFWGLGQMGRALAERLPGEGTVRCLCCWAGTEVRGRPHASDT
jgi:3-hydroxyisobutyrate dehydrogenase-like beta-hydroxyacid dehydrogenase